MLNNGLDKIAGLFVSAFFKQHFGLAERILLALQEHRRIGCERSGLAAQFPSGVDDLLLQFDQLFGLLIGRLLLLNR